MYATRSENAWIFHFGNVRLLHVHTWLTTHSSFRHFKNNVIADKGNFCLVYPTPLFGEQHFRVSKVTMYATRSENAWIFHFGNVRLLHVHTWLTTHSSFRHFKNNVIADKGNFCLVYPTPLFGEQRCSYFIPDRHPFETLVVLTKVHYLFQINASNWCELWAFEIPHMPARSPWTRHKINQCRHSTQLIFTCETLEAFSLGF